MAKFVHFFCLFLLLGVLLCACSDTTGLDDTPTPAPTPKPVIHGPLTLGGLFSDFKAKYGEFDESKETWPDGSVTDEWTQRHDGFFHVPPYLVLRLSHDQKRVVRIDYEGLHKAQVQHACDTFKPSDSKDYPRDDQTFYYSKWLAHLFPDVNSPDYQNMTQNFPNEVWSKAGVFWISAWDNATDGFDYCWVTLGNG